MEKKKSFWRGIGFALLFLAIFFGVQSIVSLPVSLFGMAMHPEMIEDVLENPNNPFALMESAAFGEITLWAMLISEFLTVAGIMIFFLIRKKNPLKQLEINKISPFTAILSLITGFSICIFVEFALSMLPIPQSMFDGFDAMFGGIYQAPYWLIVLTVGIVGPICEEVIFRGGVMNSIRRESNPAAAIILSGLAFGIMHGIPLQILYASFIGIILGVIFHTTKSLIPVIIIHIVNNIFTDYVTAIFSGWENPIIVLAVSGIVTAVCMVLMAVIERKRSYSVE